MRKQLKSKLRRARRVQEAVGNNGFMLGREGFAAISAIEGLRLSEEMKRDFREFDRRGVPASARRRSIIAKYGK